MGTAVATWGNSDAVRIPRAILRQARLSNGDRVELVVNERGNIEIVPEAKAHRQATPKQGITYAVVFAGYEPDVRAGGEPWPDEAMLGAEWESWSE